MKALLASAAVLLCCVQVFAWSGAMIVHTPSVPMGLYWRRQVSAQRLQRGAYVCFDSASPAAPAELRARVLDGRLPEEWARERMVKQVVGVAGAQVAYRPGEGVVVDGRVLLHSVAQLEDSEGRALPFPRYPAVVGPGEVWLAAEHPDGFDSRYMGAVSLGAVDCIAEPVWTW